MVKEFPKEIIATCARVRTVDKLYVKVKFAVALIMVSRYHMGRQYQRVTVATLALVKILDRLNAPINHVDVLDLMDRSSTLELNLTEMNAILALVCKMVSFNAPTILFHVIVSKMVRPFPLELKSRSNATLVSANPMDRWNAVRIPVVVNTKA